MIGFVEFLKESEELQELSKETLKSFADKTSENFKKARDTLPDNHVKKKTHWNAAYGQEARHRLKYDYGYTGSKNGPSTRMKGFYKKQIEAEKAVKEDQELQELSKDKLDSYIKKSADDHTAATFAHKNSYGADRQHWKNALRKRNAGMSLAFRKKDGEARVNVKEDVEITEISKDKLKDYISKAGASQKDLLNKSNESFKKGFENNSQKDFKDGDKFLNKRIQRFRNMIKASEKLR